MSYCMSGCSGGRPEPNYRYAPCHRSPHCNVLSPNSKYDPHLKYFCQKFGKYAPAECQELVHPVQPLHLTLQSLDHFSLPPMYRKGGFGAQFRCRPKDNADQDGGESCGPGCPRTSPCSGSPQLPRCHRPNPNPLGDAVCGLCVGPEELAGRTCREPCQDDPEDDDELPFTIHPFSTITTDDSGLKKMHGRGHSRGGGVERCLHPSNYRSFDSVTKLEYLDYFKMKSANDLSFYQSKLAVNNHRPPVCLPGEGSSNDQLDLTQPIFINAKVLNYKQRGPSGGDMSVSVSIPGPITIG